MSDNNLTHIHARPRLCRPQLAQSRRAQRRAGHHLRLYAIVCAGRPGRRHLLHFFHHPFVAGRALPVVVLCHLPHRPSLGGSRVRGAHALGAGGPVPPHLLRAAVLLHRDGARALLGRPVRRAVGSDPPAGPRPRGAAAAGHPPHLHRVRRGRYRHADHGRGLIGVRQGNREDPTIGSDILLAGLAFQVFAMGIFVILTTAFLARAGPAAIKKSGLAAFVAAFSAATLLVYLRTCFRLAETVEGLDGNLSSHELYFGVLEFAPVVVAVTLMTVWHPGRCVGNRISGTKSEETERGPSE